MAGWTERDNIPDHALRKRRAKSMSGVDEMQREQGEGKGVVLSPRSGWRYTWTSTWLTVVIAIYPSINKPIIHIIVPYSSLHVLLTPQNGFGGVWCVYV